MATYIDTPVTNSTGQIQVYVDYLFQPVAINPGETKIVRFPAYSPDGLGGAVASVNGKTGVVVLSSTDVAAPPLVSAQKTFYVATTGNDSNDGLTVGSPFLTLQKAADVAASFVQAPNVTTTVNIADGTYTLTSALLPPLIQGSGNGIEFVGNAANPQNVIITTSASLGSLFWVQGPSNWYYLRNLTLQASSNVNLIRCSYSGRVQVDNIRFGACGSGAQMYASFMGIVVPVSNYSIVGSAGAHMWADANGVITMGSRTITVSGTPAFATASAYATVTGVINVPSCTFSGAATGPRYLANGNSVINTNGGGANYFPGNSAGSVATGGQYL